MRLTNYSGYPISLTDRYQIWRVKHRLRRYGYRIPSWDVRRDADGGLQVVLHIVKPERAWGTIAVDVEDRCGS